jgi:hypothetical protein
MDIFGLSNRDRAFFVLGSPDWDSQLMAIHELLRLQRSAEAKLFNDIDDLDKLARKSSGAYADHVVDDWVDHVHGSVFQGAAHSLSAVGMLAPFAESLFCNAFLGIRDLLTRCALPLNSNARSALAADKEWDAHFDNGGHTNLVEGIMSLATVTGIDTYFPVDFRKSITALFSYRNKNLHYGFEWPQIEREKFWVRIANEGWQSSWFEHSSSDHKIWIIYMTNDFVTHCLATIDDFLEGLGRYVKDHDP